MSLETASLELQNAIQLKKHLQSLEKTQPVVTVETLEATNRKVQFYERCLWCFLGAVAIGFFCLYLTL